MEIANKYAAQIIFNVCLYLSWGITSDLLLLLLLILLAFWEQCIAFHSTFLANSLSCK